MDFSQNTWHMVKVWTNIATCDNLNIGLSCKKYKKSFASQKEGNY